MKIKIKLPGCNFDCSYCAKVNRVEGKKDSDKIKIFIASAKLNGINELQWSGGEPTIHSDFIDLVNFAKKFNMYQSLTTNGSFDKSYLLDLKKAGINRLNISLDTLNPVLFKKLTGSDLFWTVYDNIVGASEIFDEVTKINTVVSDITISGIKDLYDNFKGRKNIVPRFLQLTYKGDDSFVDSHRISTDEIGNHLPMDSSEHMVPVSYPEYSNPVACYFKNKKGLFSIIPQKHICKNLNCNKIWYINGRVFICKMRKERSFLVDKNINFKLGDIIYLGKEINPVGHRIPNQTSIESGNGFWFCGICNREHGLQYDADQCCH